MQTRVIGIGNKFCNIFTKYGRRRNHLFKELENNGITHIRERKLPNNSRVILGYKDVAANSASYAFKVNPDLTLEQKTVSHNYVLNMLGDKNVYIDKVWLNNTGKIVNKEYRTVKYRNNKIVGNVKGTVNNEYSTVHAQGEDVGRLAEAIMNGISKIYKKESVINSDKYIVTQYNNGTRTYEKRIGDTEYFFSTKK